LAGVTRPARGTLRVSDRDPFTSAATRRTIAALLPEETLPPGPSVGAALERALAIRGGSGTAGALLEPFELGEWLSRTVAGLSPEETRSVALALALAHGAPGLVALHEPLAAAPPGQRHGVLRRIRELGAAGAVVVCTAESAPDAADLAAGNEAPVPVLLALRDGRLTQPLDRSMPGWKSNPRPTFVIRCGDPGALASRLSDDPAVTACDWDKERIPGELCISGTTAEAAMTAVLQARKDSGVVVSAIARREAWR
jgi:ABC-type thiamine transport system ATPase subunit